MADNKLMAKYKQSCRIDDSRFFKCELTGITTPLLASHHVIKRSQGGDESRENILCVDYFLHDDFHSGYRNFDRHLNGYGITNSAELWLKMGGSQKALIAEGLFI